MSRLSIGELKPGMIIAQPIYSNGRTNLMLQQGTRLTDGLIKNLVKAEIPTVEVTDRFTLLVNPKEKMALNLEQYLSQAIMKYAPDNIEGNKCDRMVEVSGRVRSIASNIAKVDEVLDFCLQMQVINCKALLYHGINTAVLSMLVAGAMELSDKTVFHIGIGALLHDVGVCEMPFLINKKNMTRQEELLWREHSTYGYYFALQNNIPRSIAELILAHHERYDGSGYPKQLKGEEIPLGSRIINVCNEYDNLVTVNGCEPYEAIEFMYGGGGSYYDKEVVNIFTANLSVYPLGSMVRLTTKEIGIIVNVRENQGPRPIIQVFYNRFNKPLSIPKMVDLAKEKTIFIEKLID